MSKRFFIAAALSMIFLMLVGGMSSCRKEATSEVERIQERRTLVVLTSAELPPYEYLDDNNVPIGVDIRIAESIAEALGVELQVKNMDFSRLIYALADGEGDMVISGMTVTQKGIESADFSTIYSTFSQYIIVGTDEKEITGTETLSGTVIGVQRDTTADFYATDDSGAKSVQRFDNVADAVAALIAGNVDSVIADGITARAIVKDNASALKVIANPLSEESFSVAVGKGSDLLDVVNGVITKLVADGTIDSLTLAYTYPFAN